VIEPDVNGYKYDAFEHSAELVRAGEIVARAAIPEIRKWLEPAPAYGKDRRRAPRVNPAALPAE